MNISIISETIQPTTLKTILNACSQRYLIAIFNTEAVEEPSTRDLIFAGDINNIPYKLTKELDDCEAGIAFVTSLSKNKYEEYKNRFLFQQNHDYESWFALTEKDLARYVLEIAIDQDC